MSKFNCLRCKAKLFNRIPFTPFRNKIKYRMHLMSLLYNYTALKRVSLLVIKNMYTPQELIRVSSHETPRSWENEELQAIPGDSFESGSTQRRTKSP